MAHLVRPLIQFLPRWRSSRSPSLHLLCTSPSRALTSPSYLSLLSHSVREVHFRSRALRPLRVPLPPDNVGVNEDDESDSDGSGVRRSRNERKREARRAVRWGMDLATFSPSQIKRILRVTALEQEVFEAIMLVKRLGRDVREGKRRQFNYIGRLLREAEPELMDGLIQATKDGDTGKFLNLSGVKTFAMLQEEEDEVVDELDDDDDDDDDDDGEDLLEIAVVTRWYDGLINRDIIITNEIYSLRDVEFDRQELRQLVRKVHSTLGAESNSEENGKSDTKAANASRSLTRFLRRLAKQLPS